uniref:Uncharacterized protein n=1 Tax=Romanomermis culicivorax TaxID=13658 RepID=A0A915HFZ5_ROMCU
MTRAVTACGLVKAVTDVVLICALYDRGRIIESVALGASLCTVATAEVDLAAALEKRRICWAAEPYSVGGDQWKVYGRSSGLVIGPCYGDGRNSD